MALSELDTKTIKEYEDSSIDLVFNEEQKIESHDFFKVFLNGEQIQNDGYSISKMQDTNKIKISITKSDKITSIPKTKNIMVTFEDGMNKQKTLLNQEFSVTVNQQSYDLSESTQTSPYKIAIQEAFDIKVGELIYCYILLYDENNACYYGDSENLINDMEISLQIDDDTQYNTKIKEKEKISGYSKCEYIYRVEFQDVSKLAGKFKITAEDKTTKISA
jgi:hypothetical protein